MANEQQKCNRTLNRNVRKFHLLRESDYVHSLPDLESQHSNDDDMGDSSNSDFFEDRNSDFSDFSDFEFDQSEDSANRHISNNQLDPSLRQYSEAILATIMSTAGLNLNQAELVVNLFNNLNRRFSPEPIFLPSARYFWDRKSKENIVETFIICDQDHAHGPYRGEPKLYAPFQCGNKNFPARLKSDKFFLHISLRSQLEKNLPSIPSSQWNLRESDSIRDVSFARQAKRIKTEFQDSRIPDIRKMTLTLHADEVQAGKSSTMKIFPLFISINEMNPIVRKNHFFLVSLFVGKTKPKLASYLGPLIEELQDLETNPFSWTDIDGNSFRSTFHLICLIADAPMRAYLRSVRQYNHLQGCDWCLIKASSEFGSRVFFGIDRNEVQNLKRKHQDFLDFSRSTFDNGDTCNNPRFKGIIGVSPLLKLRSFDIVNGISVEPMHCLILGVFRSLILKGWMVNNQFDLFERGVDKNLFKAELGRRLLDITVPSDFGRAPRDLNHIMYWKSAEYDSFLVYFFYSSIKGLLKNKVINNIMCLVKIYYLSHRCPIERENIDEITNLIEEFQAGVADIYGSNFLTYNLHIMSHIPDALYHLGPNSNVSSYPLENYMGVLKEKVKRSSNIAPHLVRVFINDFRHKETITTEIANWRLNAKERKDFGYEAEDLESKIICIKENEYIQNKDQFKQLVENFIGEQITDSQINYMKSISINGKRFSSKAYTEDKKRDDSLIKTPDGQFNRIISIVEVNSYDLIAICERFEVNPVRFKVNGITGQIYLKFNHLFEIKNQKKTGENIIATRLTYDTKKAIFIPSTKFSPKYSKDYIVDQFLINI